MRETSPLFRYRELETPVMLVHGGEDIRVDYEHTRRLPEFVQSANGVQIINQAFTTSAVGSTLSGSAGGYTWTMVPGATGNVATEDVVYMLQGMGIETGIDLDKLIDAGAYISDFLGRKPNSRAANALLTKRAG